MGAILSEPAIAHGVPRGEASANARRLLETVGLDSSAANRLPHEFSGGQRQRIGIARALSLKPDILIADEAVSALDVSTQAQIITLLQELRSQFNIAIVFITHDLRVARKIADKIIVMKAGEIVECGDARDLFDNPKHPYTQELLASVPGRGWWEKHPAHIEERGASRAAQQNISH